MLLAIIFHSSKDFCYVIDDNLLLWSQVLLKFGLSLFCTHRLDRFRFLIQEEYQIRLGYKSLLENPPIATVPNCCNMGQMVAICTYSNEACSLVVVAISHSPKRLRPRIMGRSNRCGYCHHISHCVRH